jgi:D-glycero-beta-D-manno-heptose 1-phosphate adenylyltransferase
MAKLELVREKIVSLELLFKRIAVWRFKEKTIVFTNGCFDVLHLGHIEYLAKSRDLGDILIVGINSDDSVRRLKGPHRPVNNEEARATTLAALSFVDAVVVFEEDTPLELIRMVQPDILVKGEDYAEKEIVGSEIVNTRGGKVMTIKLTPGYSTTNTLGQIHKKPH